MTETKDWVIVIRFKNGIDIYNPKIKFTEGTFGNYSREEAKKVQKKFPGARIVSLSGRRSAPKTLDDYRK